MPELPDVEIYVERLVALAGGQILQRVRLQSPFLLRTVEPSLESLPGARLSDVRRIGKRVAMLLDSGPCLVIHLMIAGRLRWKAPGAAVPRSNGLAGFDFESGSLILTEASKRKRAALHVVSGPSELVQFDRGGLEIDGASRDAFEAALREQNHTLKRALTDPSVFSGIGNAYSDEILHAARLSPFKQSAKLDDDEVERLYQATRSVLQSWTDQTRAEVGDGFPDKVTAFRKGMAVHGRYRAPCPDCGAPVQRIVYAENECNYCARCQTGGRMLADRSLSRLLKQNWPKSIDELEGP